MPRGDEETSIISNTDTKVSSIKESSVASSTVLNNLLGGADVSFNVETISTPISQKEDQIPV